MVIVANESGSMLSSGVCPQRRSLSFYFNFLHVAFLENMVVFYSRLSERLAVTFALHCRCDRDVAFPFSTPVLDGQTASAAGTASSKSIDLKRT